MVVSNLNKKMYESASGIYIFFFSIRLLDFEEFVLCVVNLVFYASELGSGVLWIRKFSPILLFELTGISTQIC